jgi:hypothetical protein
MATQRWTSIGLALLLLGGLRIGYAQLLGRASGAEPHDIDARYAALKSALRSAPPDEPIFFTTRAPFAPYTQFEPREPDQTYEQKRLARVSYALAPRVLLPDRAAAGLVVFDLDDPHFEASLSRGRLAELWRSDDGLVILARRSAQ